MSSRRNVGWSVAALIAAIMAIGAVGTEASAATKQSAKSPTVKSKVDPAARVPRQISRAPSAPTILYKRKDGGTASKGSAIAGRADSPASRVPRTLPSVSDQLQERLKGEANRRNDAVKPDRGTPVGSVSGTARAELSSRLRAGLAGSAIDTSRLAGIEGRIKDADQLRDRVDQVANSALQSTIGNSLTSQLRSDVGNGLRAEGIDDWYKAVGVAAAIVKAAEIGSAPAESFLVAPPVQAMTAFAGVAAAGYAGYKGASAVISATSEPGWFGDQAGQTEAARSFQDALDRFDNWVTGTDTTQNNNGQTNNGQTGASTQTANAGDAATTGGTTTNTSTGQSTGGTTGNGSTSSNNSGGSTTGTSGADTASNGSNGGTTNESSGGSCGGGADSGTCSNTADNGDGTTPAASDTGGKGSPNPMNENSTKRSIVASMALDRMLGGNQTRQQRKDMAARTGGGVTTPYEGAETSNVTANLALDRQFNTGYASRQENHLEGKSGGNVGQPGDDLNWNRNKASKVDIGDLDVVKAMQTGIKTPTVDDSNAGNKAPSAPTVGGGFTGGGGGTTAEQAAAPSVAGPAGSSVRAELQSRLGSAMARSAGRVREQATAVR